MEEEGRKKQGGGGEEGKKEEKRERGDKRGWGDTESRYAGREIRGSDTGRGGLDTVRHGDTGREEETL